MMPSIPEVEERDDTVREQVVQVTRRAVNAAGADRVGPRPWIALGVLSVVVATNPVPLAVVSGVVALLLLAVDIAARRRAV